MRTELTPAWSQLRYHDKQRALWRTKKRFVAVVAGRGSGKTEIARRRVIRMLPITKPWPDPLYFYALPTIAQARRVAWGALKALVPPTWLAPHNPRESDMSITTIWGSKLVVLGMDKPARAEGVQYDGGVIDESSDQKPGVFALSLGPAMTHRDPWCWRIGVPKRAGPGAMEFKEFYDLGLSGQDPETESYCWPSSDILTPEKLRFARENLDAKDFNEQYNASWETVGGLIYYAYDDVLNGREWTYRPDLPLLVGSDFNVDPMCWVIAQAIGNEVFVFDELFIRNTNTQGALDALQLRYRDHAGGWKFFGDASGRARHSSASRSDYLIIRGDSRFKESRIYYPMSNPSIADKFAATNRHFASAAGGRLLFVHPRCKHLRKDLQVRGYKDGSREPNDEGDVGHITDALGYMIHALHPVTAPVGSGNAKCGISMHRES